MHPFTELSMLRDLWTLTGPWISYPTMWPMVHPCTNTTVSASPLVFCHCGFATGFYMSSIGMKGDIGQVVSILSNFIALATVQMSHNSLTGTIPDVFANSTSPFLHLTYIDLSANQLTGPIPNSLSASPLTYLNLSNNALSALPSWGPFLPVSLVHR